jgi:hypothetical protein
MKNVHRRLVEERENYLRREQGDNPVSATVESRVERMHQLQLNNEQKLFAVMFTTIHKAAFDGNVEGILHFLNKRINHVEDYDAKGLTSLHYAAERGK